MSEYPIRPCPVEISTIGAERSIREIVASAAERKALAEALGLVDILALSAEIGLARGRGETIHLDGRLKAKIVQNCVVSLDPVNQSIDEPIALRFVQSATGRGPRSGQVDVEPIGEDPPEVISGPVIDLVPIVIEHFILTIDPYPRASDAEPPDNPAQGTADERDSPFSALAGLIRGQTDKR